MSGKVVVWCELVAYPIFALSINKPPKMMIKKFTLYKFSSKSFLLSTFLFLTLGVQFSSAQAVDLASWSLSNDGNPVNVQPEVNAGNFIFSSGLQNQQFTPGFGAAATNWSINNTLTEFYEVAISPQPGENLNVENLFLSHSEIDAVWDLGFFGTRVVGGPNRYTIRYSKDPTFATFTTLVNRGRTGDNVSENLVINATVFDGETLYIRFYGTNSNSFNFFGTLLTGFWVIDENTLRITGTVDSCGSTTTWTSSGWNNGTPTLNTRVNINANYNTLTHGNFQSCDLAVSPGRTVTISSGSTVTIENQVEVNTAGNIVIEDGGSLVQLYDNAVNTGLVSVLRNTNPVTRFDFTYWSSPVAGNQLRGLSPNTLRDKYFSFNTNTQNWQTELDGNTIMQPGVGYAVRAPQSFSTATPNVFVSNVNGVPNNGVINVPVAAPNPGSVALIGNPYPSAIDADLFLLQNSAVLGGSLYFWTHSTPINNLIYNANDYAVYTLFGGTGTGGSPIPDGRIASGQGFFVNLNSAGTVTFNNAMRIAGNNDRFFRNDRPDKGSINLSAPTANQNNQQTTTPSATNEKSRLWLNMTNTQGAFSQALVGFATSATDERDPLWDADFFDGFANVIGLYSVLADNKLSVQAKAQPEDLNTSSFLLGYRSNISSEFSISIEQFDGLLEGVQSIVLTDNYTGQTKDLKAGAYTFMSEKGVFNDRFRISFVNETLSLEDAFLPSHQQLSVFSSGGILSLESSLEPLQAVTIFDLTGRQLYQNTEVNNLALQISNLSRGVLLLKVIYQNGSKEVKKISF